jgi:hypothetical protein
MRVAHSARRRSIRMWPTQPYRLGLGRGGTKSLSDVAVEWPRATRETNNLLDFRCRNQATGGWRLPGYRFGSSCASGHYVSVNAYVLRRKDATGATVAGGSSTQRK